MPLSRKTPKHRDVYEAEEGKDEESNLRRFDVSLSACLCCRRSCAAAVAGPLPTYMWKASYIARFTKAPEAVSSADIKGICSNLHYDMHAYYLQAVDNYEYETPSEFEDEEIDEDLAFTAEDEQQFGGMMESRPASDEEGGDASDGEQLMELPESEDEELSALEEVGPDCDTSNCSCWRDAMHA